MIKMMSDEFIAAETTAAYRRHKKVNAKAYCTSEGCLRKHTKTRVTEYYNGCPKDVPKTTVMCPDCNHALCWKESLKIGPKTWH